MGDFNAKIGKCPNQLPIVGQYGLGERSEAGDALYSFCVENNLTITNTLFKHPKRRRYTWTAPDGKIRNQIDYIMVHSRWRTSIRNSRSYPGADCNSDHNLVAVTFQARFTNLKKEPPTKRLDLDALTGPAGIAYATTVTNRFEALRLVQNETTPEELWKSTKTILLESAAETIGLPPRQKQKGWLSEETVQKAAEKRAARHGNPAKYKELKATVQKLVRKDKQTYTDNMCREMETEAKRGNTRSLFKLVKFLVNKRKVGILM